MIRFIRMKKHLAAAFSIVRLHTNDKQRKETKRNYQAVFATFVCDLCRVKSAMA
jgi:hypothetical protein